MISYCLGGLGCLPLLEVGDGVMLGIGLGDDVGARVLGSRSDGDEVALKLTG